MIPITKGFILTHSTTVVIMQINAVTNHNPKYLYESIIMITFKES